MIRWSLACLLVISVLAICSIAATAEADSEHLYDRALLPGETHDDMPIRGSEVVLRADSTWYGQYELIEDEYYALPFDNKEDGCWTFDRGAGPIDPPSPYIENGEGWSFLDMTMSLEAYFRLIDEDLNLGDGVPSPVIAGEKSLWIGVDVNKADSLLFYCGAGYGNDWNQRVYSPVLPYNGSGDVTLSLDYWSFSEPCYDGTQVYLRRDDETELMLNPYPAGTCANNSTYTGGTFTDSIGHYTNPESYTRVITEAEIGGSQNIQIVFEFSSDGGWSDEDCDFATIWGAFGVDDISIQGGGIDVAYDFETGLQGWEPDIGLHIGAHADIADLGSYTLLDPCECRLEGNVLEMHEGLGDAGVHPVGQHVLLFSPICDLGGPWMKTIFMEFDMYADLPLENGVLYRPGWLYYPYTPPGSGEAGWSPRVGDGAYKYTADWQRCRRWRYGGTEVTNGTPVPPDAEKVIAIIELLSNCEAFAINDCSGITNFSPIYDNIAVCATEGLVSPIIDFDTGQKFQDVGSYPSSHFDPRAPGPANTVLDNNGNTLPGTYPDVCADSLVVVGPQPDTGDPNSRWEARMWWRVAKRAPLQAEYENGSESRYKIWRDRVSDGRLIDRPYRPQFTFGWMDSAQVGYVVTRNKFKSAFREDDDDFVGEDLEENEMIWDDVLYPGSQIEYFVTSNYVHAPNDLYYLPDTTGGYFYEMEILPGLRTANAPDCGGAGFHHCVFQPAVLYIDAYGRGVGVYMENVLRTVLNGLDPCLQETGCEIPVNRNWDRYDILDACSCWRAPFVRGSVAGSNNGMTLQQLLGYRTILLNTGNASGNAMHDEDFQLFDEWLTTSDCDANTHRQVFIMNGDQAGECMEYMGGAGEPVHAPAFLANRFGATVICDAFNGTEGGECGDLNTSYCLRLLPADGGAFGTETDIDAYGSYCPNVFGFNVYSENGGTGNRRYYAEDGLKEMSFAQIVNEDLSGDGNYRLVLSSPSWHHLTARDPGGSGTDLCPRDLPSIVEAGIAEIGAALKWGFGVSDYEAIPKLTGAQTLAECQGTWLIPSEANESASSLPMNRLYQNRPNPVNATTTIRFQTAKTGHVEIAIYDVNGRLVRTLIDGKMEAGFHNVTWDGTNDNGDKTGSGIYWSQMRTGSYVSNKKVVVLK